MHCWISSAAEKRKLKSGSLQNSAGGLLPEKFGSFLFRGKTAAVAHGVNRMVVQTAARCERVMEIVAADTAEMSFISFRFYDRPFRFFFSSQQCRQIAAAVTAFFPYCGFGSRVRRRSRDCTAKNAFFFPTGNCKTFVFFAPGNGKGFSARWTFFHKVSLSAFLMYHG